MSDDHSLLLEGQGMALAAVLGGRWIGGQAMCHCPAHDDRTPSLSIRMGRSALLFTCFAGCDRADILRALRRIHPDRAALSSASPPSSIGRDRAARRPDLGRLARDLWAGGSALARSPAGLYLRRRAIELSPPVLRFHPRVPFGRTGLRVYRPAMIAAVVEDDGVVAVQRGFLDAELPALARDMDEPRRMLGTPGRGAVRLASAGRTLGLAEGLETALSAMQLLGLPVWAALGAERFGRVAIPDIVDRLILLPDNDRAGALADARAREIYARPGRAIETLWPPAHLNDWNDLLRAGGKGAGEVGGSAD